jgi:hypothetical protein
VRVCANIQEQAVYAVRPKGADYGCGVAGSCRQGKARPDRRRFRRRGNQAAHCPAWCGQVGRVSHDHPVPAAFKLLAAQLLAYDAAALAKAVEAGVLVEVTDDE